MRVISFLCLVAALLTGTAHATATVGQAAPAFTASNSNGDTTSLADLKGKFVVLEWTNDGCPFVQKHYNGNMQGLQKDATDKGAVWLSVISSAPGKQGNVDAEGANALSTSRKAHPSQVLLDPSGDLGRLYGAKTTPHMFVINPEGIVKYVVVSSGSVGRSVAETLRVLKALQSGELCPVEWEPGQETLGKA